jgi:hypothetical protein
VIRGPDSVLGDHFFRELCVLPGVDDAIGPPAPLQFEENREHLDELGFGAGEDREEWKSIHRFI